VKTAVLGLGRMGSALVSRLLDTDHQVTVWNRTPGRADELVERGATEASDARSAVDGVDAVLLSLADDAAVMGVLGGREGLLVSPHTTPVVDLSTTSPATATRYGDLLAGHFVASPVLGGPSALAAGQAALAVAGPQELLDRLEPLLSSLSSRVRRCGSDPGRAQVVKLMNNYLLMTGIAALSEAVAAGEGAGLEAPLITDLLGTFPTVAPALHNRVQDIVGGDHNGWFSTTLGAKDVALFADMVGDGRELPLARAVLGRYQAAMDAGLGDADLGAVVELVRGR
jgi:3-hydroxyisobutyrate dehydrogenase-like beta-hydroxyacid dehydrogenase